MAYSLVCSLDFIVLVYTSIYVCCDFSWSLFLIIFLFQYIDFALPYYIFLFPLNVICGGKLIFNEKKKILFLQIYQKIKCTYMYEFCLVEYNPILHIEILKSVVLEFFYVRVKYSKLH